MEPYWITCSHCKGVGYLELHAMGPEKCNVCRGKGLINISANERIIGLEKSITAAAFELAAANARIASLEKQNSDMLPYYQDHCEGALIPATEYQQWIKRAEQAEEQCAAMQAVIEYLSMRYSLCVQILPNGAWQVENQKRATEFAALEEKP